MNHPRLFAAITFFLCALAPSLTAQDKIAEALRKGVVEEDANKNLAAAIQDYQSVVSQYDEARKVAATALFRLAECYRKQGKTAEANAAYARVVKEFADQANLAEQSRGHLPKDQQKAPGGSGAVDSNAYFAQVAAARLKLRAVIEERVASAEHDLEAAQEAKDALSKGWAVMSALDRQLDSVKVEETQPFEGKGPTADQIKARQDKQHDLEGQIGQLSHSLASQQFLANQVPALKEKLLDLQQQLAQFDLETAQQTFAPVKQ